jgi:hypothetical protein
VAPADEQPSLILDTMLVGIWFILKHPLRVDCASAYEKSSQKNILFFGTRTGDIRMPGSLHAGLPNWLLASAGARQKAPLHTLSREAILVHSSTIEGNPWDSRYASRLLRCCSAPSLRLIWDHNVYYRYNVSIVYHTLSRE